MTRLRATSVDEWAEACSHAFVPLRVRTSSTRFAATLDHIDLTTHVSLTRVASERSEVYRSTRVIAENPRENLLVSLHRSGRGHITQHGRRADLVPGSAVVYDASAPYTLQFPARLSETVLQIPRRAIPNTGSAFNDLTARVLPPSTSLTALTNLLLAIDPTAAPTANSLEGELLSEAVVTLLRSSLLPAARRSMGQLDTATLLMAMQSYIEQHLTDPELTVESLASVHHVSVRLVHKLFASQNTSPGAHIRRKRLTHAHALLIGGDTVFAAAVHSGFTDPDTFTRAFKRQYDYPPSTLRP